MVETGIHPGTELPPGLHAVKPQRSIGPLRDYDFKQTLKPGVLLIWLGRTQEGFVQFSNSTVNFEQARKAALHHGFCRILIKLRDDLHFGKVETAEFIGLTHQLDCVDVAHSRTSADAIEAEVLRRPVFAKQSCLSFSNRR